MLLARDLNGRRFYDKVSDLAAALNVGQIITAEQFEGKTRTTTDSKTKKLLGLMVNHPHISPHQLAALTMPALVIVGQHDMIRHQHSLLIAHSLPRSRFVCLPGADHFCAAKQPEAFNREVLSFLSAL